MTDKEIPGYCEIHCRTERALFHCSTINSLIRLAGYPENYVREVSGWLSAGPEEIDFLVDLAKKNLKEKEND